MVQPVLVARAWSSKVTTQGAFARNAARSGAVRVRLVGEIRPPARKRYQ
ncbi:hypothetical protein [Streptomyces sp. NPDC021562]